MVKETLTTVLVGAKDFLIQVCMYTSSHHHITNIVGMYVHIITSYLWHLGFSVSLPYHPIHDDHHDRMTYTTFTHHVQTQAYEEMTYDSVKERILTAPFRYKKWWLNLMEVSISQSFWKGELALLTKRGRERDLLLNNHHHLLLLPFLLPHTTHSTPLAMS